MRIQESCDSARSMADGSYIYMSDKAQLRHAKSKWQEIHLKIHFCDNFIHVDEIFHCSECRVCSAFWSPGNQLHFSSASLNSKSETNINRFSFFIVVCKPAAPMITQAGKRIHELQIQICNYVDFSHLTNIFFNIHKYIFDSINVVSSVFMYVYLDIFQIFILFISQIQWTSNICNLMHILSINWQVSK